MSHSQFDILQAHGVECGALGLVVVGGFGFGFVVGCDAVVGIRIGPRGGGNR